MARLPRLTIPGVPQHIIQRGNNRQACFFTVQDYSVYLDKLKIYSRKYNVQVHSYVLMTNHVHLLMTAEEVNGISRLIQSLGRDYVRYINQIYSRTGTLWEGRYKSTLVDSENYFLCVSRYIELNPVRAGMVDAAVDYPWSSYQQNVMGKIISLITPHSCYLSLGNTSKERQAAYQGLFEQSISDEKLKEIRDSVNKSWVLGDPRFKAQIETQLARRVTPLGRGGDRKSEKYKSNKENKLL